MKIRKILSAIVAAAMVLTLTACNGDTESKTSSKRPKRSSSDYESSVEESSSDRSEGQSSDFSRNPFDDFGTSTSSEITPIEPEIDPDIPEAPASDFEYEYNEELGGIEITKYIGDDKEVVRIPEKIDGEKVVIIGRKTEQLCLNGVFSYCTGLTGIIIPNSVTTIGESAFSYCTGLTSIIIPNSVTTIDYLAFSGCTGLTSITIPDSVTEIVYHAFSGCTGLTTINVDSNNQNYISKDGVLYNKGMTTLIQCPAKKQGAFTIPDSVTTIGEWSFSDCTGLTSVTIPDSVSEIGDAAFLRCKELTSVTIPNSVTTIEYGAFYGCTGLTSITIPESVSKIGQEAFSGCTGLTSITIPESVSYISEQAFYNCTAEITYKGKTYTPDNYAALYKAINGN